MSERPMTWVAAPRKTRTHLPAGAADCHFHIFGPTAVFPYAPDAKFRPADAPKEALFALHAQMGISRGVIVQSGCHGFDNSVVTDALRTRPGQYLGIALLPPDAPESELDVLAGQGYRGVRFNYMGHLAPGATQDQLRALAPRLDARGMHLQIHMDAELIETLGPVLAELPCTVVLDHMGRVDAAQGLDQAPFRALLRLLENPRFWCKVSGSERISRQDPPYADAIPFARTIVERFGDRVIWGTDWPHPNFRADPPDDGDLFDLLPQIAQGDPALHALMVDNPMKLYRFEEA
jgi:2-pyrone-4,6-dicarboxylate lactonase